MLDSDIYYTTKGIYGVKIYTYNNNEGTVLFKRQLNTLMNDEMMEEVKSFLCTIDENIKKNVKIKTYRNCKSIENNDNCMIWCNTSLADLL
jgi:hypothetical protein